MNNKTNKEVIFPAASARCQFITAPGGQQCANRLLDSLRPALSAGPIELMHHHSRATIQTIQTREREHKAALCEGSSKRLCFTDSLVPVSHEIRFRTDCSSFVILCSIYMFDFSGSTPRPSPSWTRGHTPTSPLILSPLLHYLKRPLHPLWSHFHVNNPGVEASDALQLSRN